jgi:5S rRNA maturation endonuclease (ribonuclease M5)
VVVHCHAGCPAEAVVAAIGLEMGDLFDATKRRNGGSHDAIEARYPYVDEQGELLFEVVRFAGKSFRQRRPDPESRDGWTWNLRGVRRVPYRLPQVIAAVAEGRRVWIAEGEKDVHALEAAGEVATCNSGGAKKWRPEYAEHLRGAEVVIVADRDDSGREHAAQVAATLEGLARSVRIVEAAAGKDAADHLGEGLGLEDFVSVQRSDDPSPDTWEPLADVYAAAERTPEPPEILRGSSGALIYRGARHLLSGEPETLKSWIAAAACAELLASGQTVLWWDADGMGVATLIERLEALGAPREAVSTRLLYLAPDRPFDEEAGRVMERVCDERRPAMAVVDALNPALELCGLDPNKTADVQTFLRRVVGIFHGAGVATVIVDHVSKDRDSRGRWAYGSERKVGGVDVHLSVELVGEPPTRARPQGRAIVRAGKDRPGWHERGEGRRVGEFALDLRAEVPWRLELGRTTDRWRPTALMERVSVFLEEQDEPVSQRVIEAGVRGKTGYKREALVELVRSGHVERIEATGMHGGGGLTYRSLHPFRESEDGHEVDDATRGAPGAHPGEAAPPEELF